MNLGKVEIWETSLDRIVTLREGAKGICAHAADFPELGLDRQRELQSAVQDFLAVARQVPADKPATDEQYGNASVAFLKLLDILGPYLPLPDEAKKVEAALRSVDFPTWVVNRDYELGSDSDGAAAVWVNVFADEQTVPRQHLGRAASELTPYAQLKGNWSSMKNGKSLFHHVLQRVSCWKKELPDGDCRQGRRDYTKCPGTEAEELGRATGVIQRRRKFTAVSLLRMLVLTLLRKPDAKATDFQSTAAQLGLDVTSTAVENRFTPQLVGFLRAALERTVLRVLAASPQTVDLLNKFTSVRIGDSSTIALPDELADQFPGCGGILRAGAGRDEDPPAVGLPHRLDPPTANHPRHDSDATNPIAQEVAPAGSLSLFDLGYFCLDRFQNLTRAGAFWISRLQHGTSVFDAQGQPLPVAIPAAADRVGTD